MINYETTSQYPNGFKRILILSQYFKPEPGASQIRLMAMALELIRNGIDVEVITGFPNYPDGIIQNGYKGKIFTRETIEGISVKRSWLYPASGRHIVNRLLNYFSFVMSCFIPLLMTKKPDLIFVEAQPIILAFPAWLMKVTRGVPYIYNTPDLQIEYAEDESWIGIEVLLKIAKQIEAFFMRQSLSVTTVTHAFMLHFAKHRNISLSKMTFLPNGANTDSLYPMPRDNELAKRLKVGDRKVFTFAGTHAPYQGLETIIQTAELLKHRQDIVFLMVGKGPIRAQLLDQAKQMGLTNVLFRNSPFEEMTKLMSLTYASLVVLRDMPIARKMRLSKAIPPLACGVPVIYAGYGETPEILMKNNAGIQVKPEHPGKLASVIEKLADDSELRNSMSQNCRSLALRDFSWKNLVNDWLRQINAVQKGKHPKIPNFYQG